MVLPVGECEHELLAIHTCTPLRRGRAQLDRGRARSSSCLSLHAALDHVRGTTASSLHGRPVYAYTDHLNLAYLLRRASREFALPDVFRAS